MRGQFHLFTRRGFVLGLVMSFLISPLALAQQGGGGGGNGAFEFFLSSGFVGLNSSASAYDLSPGFNIKPLAGWDWLQVGGEVTYQKLSHQGGGTNSMTIIAGPWFNLGPSTGEAVFVGLGVAHRSGSSDVVDTAIDDPNGLGFFFIAGKRFPLSASFSFRPSLGVISAGTTGLVFKPLALSYHF